jgi:hypothetical protein
VVDEVLVGFFKLDNFFEVVVFHFFHWEIGEIGLVGENIV